jgi:endonuclease YncB( thermonuclease family)
MVSSGNAIDYTYFSKGYYAAEQANAIQHGWGLHQGTFQQPADYRHKEAVK